MSTEQITLLNTVSRVPHTFEANYARRLLADPQLGKVLVEWDSEKAEVLGQPRIDGAIVDDQGEPVRVPAKEVKALVDAEANEKPVAKRAATDKKE